MGLFPPFKRCAAPLHLVAPLWQTDVYDLRRGEAPPSLDLEMADWYAANDQNSGLITCYYDAVQHFFFINYEPHIGNIHHPDYRVGGVWVTIDADEYATLHHVIGYFFGNPGIIRIDKLLFSPLPIPDAYGAIHINDLREDMRFIVCVN